MYESFYPGMAWAAHRGTWPHAQHSRFVQAGAIHWHVQMLGQGPCMLLLHGTGSGNFSWRGLLPLLAEHFTVIAPDLPGHAFSSRGPEGSLSLPGMSEGLRALMRQLNLTPQVIVGHSAGAAIGAHMVLSHASLAHSTLIGLNPAWLPLPGMSSWLFGPAAKLAQLNPLSAWATAKMAAQEGAVARWIERTGSTLDVQGIELYRSVLRNSGHVHGVLSMMAAWQLKPLAARLHNIRNPVFMAIGSQDQTVPPTMAHEASLRLPQAKLVMQTALGHLAHEQDPVGTAQLVMTWSTST
ncbi:alpha/beta hydrolase [Limnohabitans sp. JirII-29]|uniref:alpha/beta fold hydrolase BchO n=1 Tax=unclassified Limnohabitans TaxID=2626134 RepID=UPI000C1E31F6|nr:MULTISPECIES: alpha/beta fold hydrolase BchO [unclassified Limnohabitans]PIT79491.1 alpha/beta hydrolase [Limnohabitans sp. JirII-31]PUE30231.1 alpha/beta hydrolase [Limnohabitans sp. JirII-29]